MTQTIRVRCAVTTGLIAFAACAADVNDEPPDIQGRSSAIEEVVVEGSRDRNLDFRRPDFTPSGGGSEPGGGGGGGTGGAARRAQCISLWEGCLDNASLQYNACVDRYRLPSPPNAATTSAPPEYLAGLCDEQRQDLVDACSSGFSDCSRE
jgi:hypothetical protein